MSFLANGRRVSLKAALLLALAPGCWAALAQDAFLALQGSTPGAVNYARLSDIQVFLDASPTRCAVFLADGTEIKAFQKCETLTKGLDQTGLVTFRNAFGIVLLAPTFVSSLITIAGGDCRLNLRNGRWAPISQSCASAHEGLNAALQRAARDAR